MHSDIRLVGRFRETVLEEDSHSEFRRQRAEELQRKLDADKEAFYRRGGSVTQVPQGASGLTTKPYGHAEPDKAGEKLNKVIAQSVDDAKRRRIESAQRLARERAVTASLNEVRQ